MGTPNEPAAPSSDETDLGATPPAADPNAPPAAAAEPDPYAEFRGPPAEGAYADFQLPDGAEADPELSGKFGPLASELGLSQTGAQKLVDFYAETQKANLENWGKHLQDLRTQAKADPEIGGAKYDETVTVARKAVAQFGGPELSKVLNQYGVGAHPAMIKAFAKIGRALGESPALDNAGGSGATQKPLHELLYKHPTSG